MTSKNSMTEGNSVQLSISNFIADLHEERKKWEYRKAWHQLTPEESIWFNMKKSTVNLLHWVSLIYAVLTIVQGWSSAHLFLFYAHDTTVRLNNCVFSKSTQVNYLPDIFLFRMVWNREIAFLPFLFNPALE